MIYDNFRYLQDEDYYHQPKFFSVLGPRRETLKELTILRQPRGYYFKSGNIDHLEACRNLVFLKINFCLPGYVIAKLANLTTLECYVEDCYSTFLLLPNSLPKLATLKIRVKYGLQSACVYFHFRKACPNLETFEILVEDERLLTSSPKSLYFSVILYNCANVTKFKFSISPAESASPISINEIDPVVWKNLPKLEKLHLAGLTMSEACARQTMRECQNLKAFRGQINDGSNFLFVKKDTEMEEIEEFFDQKILNGLNNNEHTPVTFFWNFSFAFLSKAWCKFLSLEFLF